LSVAIRHGMVEAFIVRDNRGGAVMVTGRGLSSEDA
jgi:hypothetical protein